MTGGGVTKIPYRVVRPSPAAPRTLRAGILIAIERVTRLAEQAGSASGLFVGIDRATKTLAARALATTTQHDIFDVDLSQVVTKSIGETKRNLAAMFDQARRSGALLFFDEADALFGTRTTVNERHERYANLVVNYLLQCTEAFAGIAILATNRRPKLPTATIRRFGFVYPPRRPASSARVPTIKRAKNKTS